MYLPRCVFVESEHHLLSPSTAASTRGPSAEDITDVAFCNASLLFCMTYRVTVSACSTVHLASRPVPSGSQLKSNGRIHHSTHWSPRSLSPLILSTSFPQGGVCGSALARRRVTARCRTSCVLSEQAERTMGGPSSHRRSSALFLPNIVTYFRLAVLLTGCALVRWPRCSHCRFFGLMQLP